MSPDRERLFFMHIMKTAGTSFSAALAGEFDHTEIAPEPGPDKAVGYWTFDWLLELPPERRRNIRLVQGHYPLFVGELLGVDRTLTILRDPVDRVISHLRQIVRHDPEGRWRSIEEVYDSHVLHDHIRNYQLRQFARTPEDDPRRLDERHLARACEQLDQVDVLGFTERYDAFVEECNTLFGWSVGAEDRLQVAPPSEPVPRSFRRRLEEDHELGLAFYEHARETRGT